MVSADHDQVQGSSVSRAHDALVGVARTVGATITEHELADAAAAGGAPPEGESWAAWVGGLLAGVARRCVAAGEPLLPSLCVGEDGRPTRRYAMAVEAARRVRPRDVSRHAIAERLACHRRFGGADLPDDWVPEVAAVELSPHPGAHASSDRIGSTAPVRPHRAGPRAPTSARPPACPTCFLVLPVSGACDSCP